MSQISSPSDIDITLTPGRAATLLGVDDHDVRTLCSDGKLECMRSQEGEIRIALGSLLEYAAANQLADDLLLFGDDAEYVYREVASLHEHGGAALAARLLGYTKSDVPELVSALLRLLIDHAENLETVLDEVVTPAMHMLGEQWSDGTITVGDEHRVSAMIVDALHELRLSGTRKRKPESRVTNRQRAIVGSLQGNRHEVGATMVRLVLEQAGWNVIYLGADVPFFDLMWQQRETGSSLVCVSLSPPQVASDALRLASVLGASYRADSPFRLAFGGAPMSSADPAMFGGMPFASCATFSSLKEFSAWL